MTLLKGICYQPFPKPYDPSTANQTLLFFGSDIASNPLAPLFAAHYSSSKGSSCTDGQSPQQPQCRYDLLKLHGMGVEAIRLYDWEPRNKHRTFLDACSQLNMGVLAPVSNYFLTQGGGFPNRETLIPALIKSFANEQGTDYDPAIAAIIFGNELAGYGAQECVTFTQDWVRIEAAQFPGFRPLKLGHPVQFDPFGARFPCFGFWDQMVSQLKQNPAIASRLFLAPQTYNDASYLFQNAEGSNLGWVDQAWNTYGLPIWFTEIGRDRTKPNFKSVVIGQLQGVAQYNAQHPDRLIGACFFQFADKCWKPAGDSEGSFGAFSHGSNILCTIKYGPDDFTHWDVDCNNTLNVDELIQTELYDAVTSVYKPA